MYIVFSHIICRKKSLEKKPKYEEKKPYNITLLGCLHKVEIMIEELGNYENCGEPRAYKIVRDTNPRFQTLSLEGVAGQEFFSE